MAKWRITPDQSAHRELVMFAALRSECASGAGGRTGPAASSVRSTDAAQLTLVLRTRSSNSARVFSVDRAEDKRGLIGQVLPPAPDAKLCRRLLRTSSAAGNLIIHWPCSRQRRVERIFQTIRRKASFEKYGLPVAGGIPRTKKSESPQRRITVPME